MDLSVRPIHPGLGTCLLFCARMLGVLFGVLLLIAIVAKMVKGGPAMDVARLPGIVMAYAGTACALGLALYLILRLWAWSVLPTGIAGRSHGGRRVHIAWADVDRILPLAINGIPAFLVTSTTSKHEIHAYTLGVDVAGTHAQLLRHAGPDHRLTRFFAPPPPRPGAP